MTPIFAPRNRHGVYLVENPVDNHFSLWITLYHIVSNTTSLLVYSIRCPSVDRGAVLSGRDRGRNSQKSARSTPQKKYFSAFFLKKFFRAYILFPLLYQKKREKIAPKNFLKKRVDMGRPKVYYRDTPRGDAPKTPAVRCTVSGSRSRAFNCATPFTVKGAVKLR